MKDIKGKKIIVFCAGGIGKYLVKNVVLNVECFVDNNVQLEGTYIGNIPVHSAVYLKSISKEQYTIIVATKDYRDEITLQLENIGFVREKDFIYWDDLISIEDNSQEDGVKAVSFESTRNCNSRCEMCDCWKRPSPDLLTLEEVEKIFSDKVFTGIEAVNFSGGEPLTLKSVIPYVLIFKDKLRNFKTFSINSNGLLVKKAVEEFDEINKICQENKIQFVVSISLDGLDEIHDKQRGVKGAFEKAVRCLDELKQRKIPIQACTTITKNNIWQIEELLAFEDQHDFYRILRMVRSTERFLDEGQDFIANFDEDELYQLKLILYKLYFKGSEHQKVISILALNFLNREDRMDIITCPYEQGKAVVLDCQGNLISCCYPYYAYGKVGNMLEEDGEILLEKIKQKNKLARNTICYNCTEEYYVSNTERMNELMKQHEEWKTFFSLDGYYNNIEHRELFLSMRKKDEKMVLITGWYGTETTGDKAILGELIQEYREQGFEKIKVTSIYPFVTERTLKELNEQDVEVIKLYSNDALQAAMSAEIVVMGGGPLMEMELLAIPLWLFNLAKLCGKKTVIEGCGIGPLKTERGVQAVKDILELADEVKLRDMKSCAWSMGEYGIKATHISDPATKYIERNYLGEKEKKNKKKILACFLREITMEYSTKEENEFYRDREKFEKSLAENIKAICKKHGLVPYFYSMHNFVVGNDDRDFNYRFVMKYFKNEEYVVDNKLSSIEKVINAMKEAEISLCMRFHSVLFAETLGVEYLAIDYTQGGKIAALLEEKNKKPIMLKDLRDSTECLVKRFEMQ